MTISVGNMDGQLLAGMYAEIKVVTDVVNDAMIVPVTAIINRDGSKYVMVEEDGKAYQKEIVTGIDDGNEYVLLEGLTVGEHLIVKGSKSLVDGQDVTVVNRKVEDMATAAMVNEEDMASAEAADDAERGDK